MALRSLKSYMPETMTSLYCFEYLLIAVFVCLLLLEERYRLGTG